MGMRIDRLLGAGLLLWAAAAIAEPNLELKLSAEQKDKMTLLTDGKGHYVGVLAFTNEADRVFYGDGKKFFAVPTQGYLEKGGVSFSYSLLDPRFVDGYRYRSFLELEDGKYQAICGDRKIPLTLIDSTKARPMLDAAAYSQHPRRWRSYALSRDNRGNYYYVDRGRLRGTEGQFRLFVGPKGKLVQQKMTNVVSDSQGDIFSTKTGDLRLILDAAKSGGDKETKEGVWMKNEKPTPLTIVPIDGNVGMIYNDLGVYTGERLGMPCDDL